MESDPESAVLTYSLAGVNSGVFDTHSASGPMYPLTALR